MIFENNLQNAVIFCAAATNFDSAGEIAEIRVIDAHTGKAHLNAFLRPAGPVNPESLYAYNLPDDFSVGAGRYTDYEDRLKELLIGNVVLLEDGVFTANLLLRTAQAHNCATDWIESLIMAHCVDLVV